MGATDANAFNEIPVLSGGLGNVVYFFLIIFGLFMPGTQALDRGTQGNDLLGNGMMMPRVFQAHAAAFPEAVGKRGAFSMAVTSPSTGARPPKP